MLTDSLSCGGRIRHGCPCIKTAQTGKGNTHCPVPKHGQHRGDEDPSLSITPREGELPLVHCHAGCDKNEVIVVLQERGLWDGALSSQNFEPQPTFRRWDAYDATSGDYVSTHVRSDRPGEDKKVRWEPKGVTVKDLALYRNNALSKKPGLPVVICEGESATDALATIEDDLGIVAVGTVTGAGTTPGDAALSVVIDRMVQLWPDEDEPGKRHMANIADRLDALGCQDVHMVSWPDAPPKGDAADAITQGMAVQELLTNAQPSRPECRQIAKAKTKSLGELLGNAVRLLRDYVVLTESQLDTVALWIAHSHAFDAAECTPYLSINSPEKQSGKTRLLEVLEHLVAEPWFTSHATAAALVRKVSNLGPTLLLDETDAAFKGDKEYAETLRGILNSGYRLGGVASLCIKAGGDWNVVNYPVFCPKAFAGIGKNLPATVQDRSISIEMRRRDKHEHVKKFRRRDAQTLAPIQHDFSDWAKEAVPILQDARPDVPEQLDDRAQDVWEPLIAIADLAGDGWPERARLAALALSAGANREDESIGVVLLKDIRSVFQDKGTGQIPTPQLLAALVAMEEAPWGDLRAREIDARRLARMLKPYDIKPTIWKNGEKTTRGYQKEDFVDAWVRYVPLSETNETAETDGVPVHSDVSLVSLVSDNPGDREWLV